MRRFMIVVATLCSVSFAQFLDDEIKEFGLKVSYAKVKYDSVEGTDESETLDETLSLYGYIGSETASGFVAGVSLEGILGSKVNSERTIVYTSLELNPQAEFSFGDRIRAYTGFGGSLNRIKEAVQSSTNKDLGLGLQFFVGLKYNLVENFGVLGEYKAKLLVSGDYSDSVIHHFNLGIYFLFR